MKIRSSIDQTLSMSNPPFLWKVTFPFTLRHLNTSNTKARDGYEELEWCNSGLRFGFKYVVKNHNFGILYMTAIYSFY